MQSAWETVILNQTVDGNVTIYSSPINFGYDEAFSYKITIVSGSAPDISLIFQIHESGQGDKNLVDGPEDRANGFGWISPTTNATLIASGFSAVGSLADGFKPTVTKWGRFGVTGISANSANTVVTVKVCKQPKAQ